MCDPVVMSQFSKRYMQSHRTTNRRSPTANRMDDDLDFEKCNAIPHFSPEFYCGGVTECVCFARVVCTRAPSDSSTHFEYASGVLGGKPCIHIYLHLLATNPGEKCGIDCYY